MEQHFLPDIYTKQKKKKVLDEVKDVPFENGFHSIALCCWWEEEVIHFIELWVEGGGHLGKP